MRAPSHFESGQPGPGGGSSGASASSPAGRRPRAFTLVELLVVMGIIVLLLAIVGPVVTSMKSSGDVSKAIYDVAGILEQARTYAMSSSTYVYVGFLEVDGAQSSSANPQAAGSGRVEIAVVASRDGTPGYSRSDPANTWASKYGQGQNFSVIGKPVVFDNLHLVNLGARPTSGQMSRAPLGNSNAVDANYNLGDTACASVTPFSYPLGSGATSGRYNFAKVIQFSPQGIARIQRSDNSDIVAPWLEIGVQQARGNVVTPLSPPVSTGNVAAIQVNGATGAVRIYRP